MKAAITEGKGDIKLAEVPIPEIGPYQCLCKNLFCTTCTGTDQKIIGRKMLWAKNYPAIVGHESIGRVIKIGRKVRNIKEGTLFLRQPSILMPSFRCKYRKTCPSRRLTPRC